MIIPVTITLVITALAEDLGGVGLIIVDRKAPSEPLRTGNVVVGGPAERAGITPDWFLISVDGTNTVNLSLAQSINIVRGPAGTTVTLELADPAMRQTNKFTLKRLRMVFKKDRVDYLDP